jgi:hypothetical protein
VEIIEDAARSPADELRGSVEQRRRGLLEAAGIDEAGGRERHARHDRQATAFAETGSATN